MQAAGQVQQGSRECSERFRKALARQDQQGSGPGGARSGSTTFRIRFREALVQVPGQRRFWKALVESQAKFNDVPEKVAEKVPEKVPEGLGQVQQGSRRFQRRFRKMLVQSRARSNEVPEGFGEGSRVQVGSGAIPGVCRRSF